MFSDLALRLIIYGSLIWTGLAFLTLVILYILDTKNKSIW
jgi:hypothetical protein